MERRGLIEAEWGTSELGRKAKFYRLTAQRPPAARGRHRAVGPLRDRGFEGTAAGMKFGERLRSRFWRMRVDDEVDAEFDFHVEMRARELVERGMDPAEAREAAIRRFGNIDRVNATCRAIGKQRDSDMRRTEYLSELKQDVTFACRQIAPQPGIQRRSRC